MTKNVILTTQSIIIATQTPNISIPKYLDKTTPKPILTIHMEHTPTIIVYRASFEALNVFGSVNDKGHRKQAHIPWNKKTLLAKDAVSSDRLYNRRIKGVAKKMITFNNIIKT